MKRYTEEKCPYEIEYNKLSNEDKAKISKPCKHHSDCILDPTICANRLMWAYNKKINPSD